MQVQVSLTIEISATASLTEMEQQIQVAGQQAMREALKQAIRQREDQTPCCPHCGQKQRRLEGTVRRTIATTFGRVGVARRRFRGLGCWRSFCPANQLFTELKGGTISHPLRIAAAWPPGQSRSTDALWRPLAPRGGHSRRGQVDQEATRAVLPASHLYSGLGASLARSQWRHPRGSTS